MTIPKTEAFERWAIIEFMGHRRIGGLATEGERFGAKMLRVDIPPVEETEQTITQYYGGSSIYALTITDEETARAFAMQHQQRPIDDWSARRMLQIEVKSDADHTGEDDLFDDGLPI